MSDPGAVIDFWFTGKGRDDWFRPPPELDKQIAERFGETYARAAKGELAAWAETAVGALALILVLDQFPRNLFRDDPRAYSTDDMAVEVADAAIARGFDMEIPIERRVFFYLPYEHSETLARQERACTLTKERCDIEEYASFAERHRVVIERFGRFPHRNEVLGRKSTEEEIDYLEGRDEPF